MRARRHADAAARQRSYRERKRNAETAQIEDESVTFDALLQALPAAPPDSTDEAYTPRWVIDAARATLGAIDLDPASSPAAQAVVQAERYFTAADDGLVRPWAGRVWCNPPYSDPLPWVRKLIAHYRAREVSGALLLLNLAGSPEWARMLWGGGYPVCILAQRIEFIRPGQRPRSSKNTYDQFIWYFGGRPGRFRAAFERYGAVR